MRIRSSIPALAAVVCGLWLTAPAAAQQQINVEVVVDKPDPISSTALSAELSEAKLLGGSITQTMDQVIMIDVCDPGSFSATDSVDCTNCPAGTASPTSGADNAMTCHSCSAGSWSGEGSANCTTCGANTFSTTYRAETVATCVQCPAHTTSPGASPQVQSCVCDNSYFQSDNLLPVFDGVLMSLGFDGAAPIDVPHVSC